MECLYLSPEELAALIAEGWTHNSGPFPTVEECLANCNSSSSSTVSDNCFDCGPNILPMTWRFSLSGIIDDGTFCTNCNTWNQTIDLPYIGVIEGQGCTWGGDYPLGYTCTNPSTGIILAEFAGSLRLYFLATPPNAGGAHSYSIAIEELDCNGPNVLTQDNPPTDCAGWPGTITINPIY